jgi:hypothetical protein
MKHIFSLLLILLLIAACKKVPERQFIEIRALSIGGVALVEGQGIELDYGDEADIIFEYETTSPLKKSFIQLIDNYLQGIDYSDDENITNHPKEGDTGGQFTYRVKTQSQFDPPIGNSVFDTKGLQVVMSNELGTIEVFTISILVK